MMADREAERAERQANLAALQQIAQNNQGHGNHDHPGSKLKNFQNTNPPMFSKTEEPLDADDWLQTIENNLEVAGVEAAEKVLFATHYLSGPARAWWTSARAMNAGQMMTWEDFKLKFSKYHVPQGLIKKMRDEFRELKQGRMSVVEYRDRFLTLSRYAPDETDTNEKRKERFLNGLHDEMQTVLVNIPFADLEALVDSAIQMEGKLHQANENRKRRMMNQSGPHHTQKHRNNSSGGFTPRNNKPPAQTYRPNYTNNHGGPPKPGGTNNNNRNPNSHHNNGNYTNTNPGPELEVMPSPSPRGTNQRWSPTSRRRPTIWKRRKSGVRARLVPSVEKLERPPPKFHGVRIHNTPTGEQQWMITADLKGSSEPPISERILFSFKAYSWVDGLAHALQEGLARVCGQNIAALRGSRFAHFARHDTMGEPMALSSHPVLKIHVQHLDFMLHETRKDLELTRVHSHRAQMALAHHADAIRLLAKDRRSLRLQRAKNDQIQEMEEDGEDIQGGNDFLSDDNDFEDDEFTDEEDYEFLEAAEDGIIPIDVDEDNEE
ncbi:hypothetical protein QYE76_010594 [Lolium multiflorum]|uniref:Retrotransposon gag domain-containing protein n=1 Tax=Lolium multiflorum TaxID=4521 RepID=A0AAD8TXJ0_LOLMU|nr:hypothetical protein QYE76_010594 [Lolium multiflorum]